MSSKMAATSSTLTLRSKIEEDHLTCTVCMCNFNKPKALPCLHTFCEGCLQDFVVSRNYEGEGRFPCPICRTYVDIPVGGVGYFPDNHLLTSLLDTVEHAKKPPKVPARPRSTSNPSATQNKTAQVGILVSTKHNVTTPLYPDLSSVSSVPVDNDPTPQQNQVLACSNGLVHRFGKFGPGLVDFFRPIGLAISQNGEFVIADEGGNRILIFHSSGQLRTKFACKCTIKNVAVTAKNDILVSVTGSGSAIMHLYDMTGKLLSAIGQHYRYETPNGISCLPNGQVAVTGLDKYGVYMFNSQYTFSGTMIGRKGSGDNHFLSPRYVTSNSKSCVIVSDSGNNNIQIFSSAGKFKLRFGGQGENHGYFNNPLGVATDNKDNIVVADSNNYRVELFSPKGRYLATVVQDTFEIQNDVQPVNVAVTKNNQYVVLLSGPQFAEVRVYVPSSNITSSDHPETCKTQ